MENYNTYFDNYLGIDEAEIFDEKTSKKYCFEISHDCKLDLSEYKLAIKINKTFAYVGMYKSLIVLSYLKEDVNNTFTVFLYDEKNGHRFRWSNKDVYDFEDFSKKCYKVTLRSTKNINYSDDIHMDIR